MTKLIAMGSGGMQPSTPTIGTATDGGTGSTVSVAFTPSTYIGKGTITYTATSSPGGFTGTASSSPITVSGLSVGTAYTFTVVGTTNYGVSSNASAASNSVTPAAPSQPMYESIASTRLSSLTTTITLSSIPNTYKHLQLRFAGFNNNDDYVYIQTNLTGNRTMQMYGVFGTLYTATLTPGTYGFEVYNGGIGAATMGAFVIDIHNYASPIYKNFRQQLSRAAESQYSTVNQYMYLYDSSTAVNSITIRSNNAYNLGAGTTVSLYGIKV